MKHPLIHAALAGALALAALGGGVAAAQHHDDGRHDDHHPGPPDRGGHGRWQRGDRVPPEYRAPSRYIDYRRYHLHPPGRGYQWVRTDDGGYALVALTTGLIAELAAGR